MIIGISGIVLDKNNKPMRSEGAGKTEVANFLKPHGFVALGLADVMKRIAHELFDFPLEHLFGPSGLRNVTSQKWGLTSRHVLQQLGTEVGRSIHEDVWVEYAIKAAKSILNPRSGKSYDPTRGLFTFSTFNNEMVKTPVGVAIHDVRFPNELAAIKRHGGKTIRVVRPSNESSGLSKHASSTGLFGISNSEIDYIISNQFSLPHLKEMIDELAPRLLTKW